MWSENVVLRHDQYVPMSWRRRTAWRLLEGFLLKRVDHLISVSNSICDEFKRRYRLKERPVLVPNVPERDLVTRPDPDRAVPSIRQSCRLTERHFVTVYLGGINPARNIENVIEAHRHLGERYVFVIRGPGIEHYGPIYVAQAAELGLEGRVLWLPPVDPDQIIEGARGADCGIVMLRNLCRNFYWFLPNKLFEYMAGGIPVAVSKFPDITEHVERNQCGVTFDPHDPISIAAAIRWLGEHPDEAREMGRRGLEAVLERDNWETGSRPLVEGYDRLGLASRSP